MKSLLASAAVALSLLAGAAQAATVASITSAEVSSILVTGDPAMRIKDGSGADDLYVGVTDLGAPGNRATPAPSIVFAATQAFSFTFDQTTGVVSGAVGAVSGSYTTAADTFNALVFQIRNNPNRNKVFSIENLIVNGEAVGSFAPGAGTGTLAWLVTGFGAQPLLSVSGTLGVINPGGGNDNENVRVDFALANVAPIPVPAALPLMLLALGGLGLAARRRRAA